MNATPVTDKIFPWFKDEFGTLWRYNDKSVVAMYALERENIKLRKMLTDIRANKYDAFEFACEIDDILSVSLMSNVEEALKK